MQLVVHPQLDGQVVEIAERFGRDDPRPHGRAGLEVLLAQPVGAEVPVLTLAEVAQGQIVDDGIAGDVVHRIRFGDISPRLADHGADLGLPVDLFGNLRQPDRGVRADDAMQRRLDEEIGPGGRLVRRFAARHLLHVVGVIGGGAEYGARIQDRCKQGHVVQPPRCGGGGRASRRGIGGEAFQCRLGQLPIVQDGKGGAVIDAVRRAQCGEVQHLLADAQPGARPAVLAREREQRIIRHIIVLPVCSRPRSGPWRGGLPARR